MGLVFKVVQKKNRHKPKRREENPISVSYRNWIYYSMGRPSERQFD